MCNSEVKKVCSTILYPFHPVFPTTRETRGGAKSHLTPLMFAKTVSFVSYNPLGPHDETFSTKGFACVAHMAGYGAFCGNK